MNRQQLLAYYTKSRKGQHVASCRGTESFERGAPLQPRVVVTLPKVHRGEKRPLPSDDDGIKDDIAETIKTACFAPGKVYFSLDEFEYAVWLYSYIRHGRITGQAIELCDNNQRCMQCNTPNCRFDVRCQVYHTDSSTSPAPIYSITSAFTQHTSECKLREPVRKRPRLERPCVMYLYWIISDEIFDKVGELARFITDHFAYTSSESRALIRSAFQEYGAFGEDEDTDNICGMYAMAVYIKCCNEANGVSVFRERDGCQVKLTHLIGAQKIKQTPSRLETAKNLVVAAYNLASRTYQMDKERLYWSLEKYNAIIVKQKLGKVIPQAVEEMIAGLEFDAEIKRRVPRLLDSSGSHPPIDGEKHTPALSLPKRIKTRRTTTTSGSYESLFHAKTTFSTSIMQDYIKKLKRFGGSPAHGIFVATEPMKAMASAVRRQWYLTSEPSLPKTQTDFEFHACYSHDSDGNKAVLAVAFMPAACFGTWLHFAKALHAHYGELDQIQFVHNGINGVGLAFGQIFSQTALCLSVAQCLPDQAMIGPTFDGNVEPLFDTYIRSLPLIGAIMQICDNQLQLAWQILVEKPPHTNKVLTFAASVNPKHGLAETAQLPDVTASLDAEEQRQYSHEGETSRHVVASHNQYDLAGTLRQAAAGFVDDGKLFYHNDFAFALTVIGSEMQGCMALPSQFNRLPI